MIALRNDSKDLTIEDLDAMAHGQIFSHGVALDSPEELNITGSGNLLRWVTVRGAIGDWTIYYHEVKYSIEWIKDHGDKVIIEKHIRMLVPCTDAAFAKYRY